MSFASAGPNTRTTQLFVNLNNNYNLDTDPFAPVGNVSSGMNVIEKLYSGYKDEPTPHQPEMETQGNAWLQKHYPKLDEIKSAVVSNEENPALPLPGIPVCGGLPLDTLPAQQGRCVFSILLLILIIIVVLALLGFFGARGRRA